MDGGTNWNVYAMNEYAGELIVGGRFTTAGALPANRVATWLDCEPCPGELTGDGNVGVGDLLILIASWGACGDCTDCPADLNGDGNVGVADLLILISNWG